MGSLSLGVRWQSLLLRWQGLSQANRKHTTNSSSPRLFLVPKEAKKMTVSLHKHSFSGVKRPKDCAASVLQDFVFYFTKFPVENYQQSFIPADDSRTFVLQIVDVILCCSHPGYPECSTVSKSNTNAIDLPPAQLPHPWFQPTSGLQSLEKKLQGTRTIFILVINL